MAITAYNISEPLVEACRTLQYPSDDAPEVQGLLRGLDQACSRRGSDIRLRKAPGGSRGGW